MSVIDHVRIVIYRVNKKGLEIFLVNSADNKWGVPQGKLNERRSGELDENENIIELDDIQHANGNTGKAWAVEGDWHEIPSIRGIIKQDVQIVKSQIKQRFPDLGHGTYFAVKEAIKKVMPEEYALLKELKEVILDRNQAKYI